MQNLQHVILQEATFVFERPANGADTLFDLGGDSLLLIELLERLEEKMGRSIDLAVLASGKSLADIATELDK